MSAEKTEFTKADLEQLLAERPIEEHEALIQGFAPRGTEAAFRALSARAGENYRRVEQALADLEAQARRKPRRKWTPEEKARHSERLTEYYRKRRGE